MEPFKYKTHTLEVRRSYWPNGRIKHYYGFVDGCHVPHPCGYGWIGGFDDREVLAMLKGAVDKGVHNEQVTG